MAVLYQRGEFTAQSTELVAWALLWYAAGLVGHALVEILSRAFYALHDTRTPVTVGVIAMGINVGLSLLFPLLFERWGWMPHGGLALANSLATGLESIALVLLMRRRMKGLNGAYIWKGVGNRPAGDGPDGGCGGWVGEAAQHRVAVGIVPDLSYPGCGSLCGVDVGLEDPGAAGDDEDIDEENKETISGSFPFLSDASK